MSAEAMSSIVVPGYNEESNVGPPVRRPFDRSMFTKGTLKLWFRTFIDRRGNGLVS